MQLLGKLRRLKSAFAGILLCGLGAAPLHAAPVLTIEVEAQFAGLPSFFAGDAPNSVDIARGDTISFRAVLTDLERTRTGSFLSGPGVDLFNPTVLEATASVNGADFTFGNVEARTDFNLGVSFNLLGDTDFTDPNDFALTGSGPSIENAIFAEYRLISDFFSPDVIGPFDSFDDLIPSLNLDVINIAFYDSIVATGPGELDISRNVTFGVAVTRFDVTLTDDAAVVPLPGAFALMASGLGLIGARRAAGALRRRRRAA